MSVLLLAVLTGCSSPDSPAPPLPQGDFPAVEMPRGPSTDALQLHKRTGEARYTLADNNLPEGFDASGRIRIEFDTPQKGRTRSIPIPFELDADSRTRFGSDLVVRGEGRAFRYVPLGGGSNTWRILKGNLFLGTRKTDTFIELDYAGASELFGRYSLSGSGMEPATFVERDLTLQGRTVPGIFLTSPSSATWTLDIPERAPRFRAETSVLPSALTQAATDGLTLQLVVTDAEGEHVVGERRLEKVQFETWELDLATWAGKTVDVSLRTLVEGAPDHDHAFVGAPTIWGAPEQEVRRVVVIGLDTTRPRSMGWYGYGRNSTPELDALANSAGVAVNAWTPAPRTRPSFRSATTGRYPLLAVGAKNIGEVFQDNGFATAGWVANIHLQPRFDFDQGFDTWLFDGKADADVQVDRALGWFRANEDRDTYMFLHFMDPHLAYAAPGEYRDKFVEDPDPDLPAAFSRWQVMQWMANGKLTQQRKEHIVGLYDGEMAFMSREIGRLVRELDAMPGKTLIVVHSDHGEEFFEHDGFEHNHTLYDDVTRAVLWVRPPGGTAGGPVRFEQNATLADIAPTLYDFVGFDDTPPTDGISLRPWLEGAEVTPRDIGIAHLRYGLDRYGVVHDQHKYIVMTGSGAEELYDLQQDPGEQRNLAGTTDLAVYRQAVVSAHPELDGGLGWRVFVNGRVPPFTLDVPGKTRAVGILHPEATDDRRPNLAWGEQPGPQPEEVGDLKVEAQRLTFHAKRTDGQLYVLFDGEVPPPTIELTVGGNAISVPAEAGGVEHRFTTGGSIRVERTMVLVPPPGEAARMSELGASTASGSSDETCRLCELGYIEGTSCEGC